jgi:hypothetical protein
MNKLLFIAVVGCFFIGCAGTYENITPEQARFEKVFETTVPKDKVYDKCMQWISHNFKSAKAVIEYQDKDAGKIIGNGSTSFTRSIVEIPLTFTMEISIKDGKYRLVFDNLIALWGEYHNNPRPIQGTATVAQVHAKFAAMCDNLNAYVNKADDNW